MTELAGSVAIVTGASSGIGAVWPRCSRDTGSSLAGGATTNRTRACRCAHYRCGRIGRECADRRRRRDATAPAPRHLTPTPRLATPPSVPNFEVCAAPRNRHDVCPHPDVRQTTSTSGHAIARTPRRIAGCRSLRHLGQLRMPLRSRGGAEPTLMLDQVLTRNPATTDSHGMTASSPWLLLLVRMVLLVVLFFFLLSTVVSAGGPTTGPLEKAVLAVVFFGLLGLAVPVHRIGRRR